MRLLRTISTRRLLAVLAGLVVAIIAGSAIAIAATGSGPVPAPKPLASAVHAALSAPAVPGITARITFANHLISASNVEGTDPLLNGGSGRLWLAPGHGLRLEVQGDNGDAQVVVANGSFWAYDPTSQTVYEGRLPAQAPDGSDHSGQGIPSVAEIQSAIARLAAHVGVSRAIPGDVARRPAYTVRLTPKDRGGLLGGVALTWDSVHGVPLRFDVYARGTSSPVLELTASRISYKAVSPSVFRISPPRHAKVVKIDFPASAPQASARGKSAHAEITGMNAVASRLSFRLDAPARLAGLPRTSVSLLGSGKQAGAVVTYGQGLGSLYVMERPGGAAKPPTAAQNNGNGPGLSLPSVSLRGGTSALELPTALGTVLQFARGGVTYVVGGSVPSAQAESAARSL